MHDIEIVKSQLLERIAASNAPSELLRTRELKQLYGGIAALPTGERARYGKLLNDMRRELEAAVDLRMAKLSEKSLPPIDVTAPFDVNAPRPKTLSAYGGSIHPLMQEMAVLEDVFGRMGFTVEDSREIDDQFHMFDALNFPADHPARDDYDTFLTTETDGRGNSYVAPAHTSTMQNRLLRKYASHLAAGQPIAAVVPDRVFRNEDLDARHEHTFYQVEGIYVDRNVHAGMIIATLQTFLSEYYGRSIDIRTNPFYFPFTEPSFEMALSCPFCDKAGCKVCGFEGWIELLGCGMIHPNVLRAADIDPETYSGFAWGMGLDRLVMMKHGIEDVRHFESGKLDFLKQL